MKLHYALILSAFVAAPAMAQSNGTPTSSNTATGAKSEVSASLASSAKVTVDSAKAIARASGNWGEVSSAELKLKKKRLVYQVKLLNKSKRASEVFVDAMTGEVVSSKEFGGLKSTVIHHKENKKLLGAKRDSAAKNP